MGGSEWTYKNNGALLLSLVHDPEPHRGAEGLGDDGVARSRHMGVEASHDDVCLREMCFDESIDEI